MSQFRSEKIAQFDYQSEPWSVTGGFPDRPDDDDAFITTDQLDYLIGCLTDVPHLIADLEITEFRQDTRPPRPTPPDLELDESTLPFQETVARTRADLTRTVYAAAALVWHRATHGQPQPFRRAADAAAWLMRQPRLIAQDPQAEAIGQRIAVACQQSLRVIDRPAGIRYRIPCPNCSQPVPVLDTGTTIECAHCGWAGDATDELQQLLTDADDRLLTAGEIAAAGLTIGTRPVTRDQIDGWARRGRLAVREQKRWHKPSQTIVTTRTFRVGDVIAIVHETEQRITNSTRSSAIVRRKSV